MDEQPFRGLLGSDGGGQMQKAEVIKKIGVNNWLKFLAFMQGQTISIVRDGKADYYEWDVRNFINKMKGKPTFFD